ncbi:MAG: hypothetical protein Q8922_00955 [Bacteroidota bacterium]|nr:hypothetical protein [Bacteroidota bacterium]MDP4232602.1 hypothetical protein [Bacteroidota bacterium]MDP4242944.1 hypothetical protein [Bacteroidota bacterium]MDP4286481.1 hypothetical protein [Bacteroidota bacterium]
MKRIWISLACALFLLTIASCHSALQPNLIATGSSDTIAHWSFDGNTRDVSGNGHDGVLTGTTNYIVDRFGHAGKAIELISISGGMHVPSILDFDSNDSYTISAWANVSARGGWGIASGIYGFGGDTSGFQADLMGCGIVRSGRTISADAWRMFTLVVVAHTSATLYRDSLLVATKTYGDFAGSPGLTQLDIRTGTWREYTNDSSRLDDIIILHRAMSAAEVSSRYHEGGWYARQVDSSPSTPTSRWTQGGTLPAGGIQDICWIDTGRVGIACGLHGAIWRSADSGRTWQQIQQNATQKDLYAVCFESNGNGEVDARGIVVGDDGAGAGILYTTDYGLTWMPATLPSGIATLRGAIISLLNRSAVGSDVAGNGVILFSSDPLGGKLWKLERHTPKPLYGVVASGVDIMPGYPLIAVGDGGQIFVADSLAINGDSSRWKDRSTGTGNWRRVSISSTSFPYEAIAISDQGAILRSAQSLKGYIGEVWTPGGGVNAPGSIYDVGSNKAWVAGERLLFTMDGGMTWNDQSPTSGTWLCISHGDGPLAILNQSGQLYFLKK